MHSSTDVIERQALKISSIYVMAALCKLHSAAEQKLSVPFHATLLNDFAWLWCQYLLQMEDYGGDRIVYNILPRETNYTDKQTTCVQWFSLLAREQQKLPKWWK